MYLAWLCNWWKSRERLPNPLSGVPLCLCWLRDWLRRRLCGWSRLWWGLLLEKKAAWTPVEVECTEKAL